METNKTENWVIDRTDAYYYHSSRNGRTWVEITFWYNPQSLERKETTRDYSCYDGQEWQLPEWAKVITKYYKHLNYN